MTEHQPGYTPRQITATQAMSRVQDVKDLLENEDYDEANLERAQLYADVLFTLAHVSYAAHVREIRRLAGIALEAFEIPIVRNRDAQQSQSG